MIQQYWCVEQLVLIEPMDWQFYAGDASAALLCSFVQLASLSTTATASARRYIVESAGAASHRRLLLLCRRFCYVRERSSVCVRECVCLVLSWISSSVPDSYITRPKKVSWLARVYFAFVARRVHTSLARLAHLTQNPNSWFWVPETKSEFRSDRERVSFFVSCSLAADAECQCQCIKFFFFYILYLAVVLFAITVIQIHAHTQKHRDLAEITSEVSVVVLVVVVVVNAVVAVARHIS